MTQHMFPEHVPTFAAKHGEQDEERGATQGHLPEAELPGDSPLRETPQAGLLQSNEAGAHFPKWTDSQQNYLTRIYFS